ncbi:hypothetical protein BJ322DRAFT_1020984 [Thelephora terrestris]|uniref:Protein kinase domain-containing protein n=1 Tax=Thelephora terrestris TaxID=56493 RepID=A0A9P6HEG6_9AGAM|nr:hypothetical protein BJ322DRAFT_1020984 [Thelephora terrestris]
MLIDDDGNARLAIAIPDTPTIAMSDESNIATLLRSRPTPPADIKDFPYGVPEIKSMESDVYGMAIVIYELLTGIVPYWDGSHRAFPVVPARPPGVFDDTFWGLLAKCWRRRPQERPPIGEVYRKLKSRPKLIRTLPRLFAAGESAKKYEWHVHGIKFPNDQPPSQEFHVKLRYKFKDYMTAPTDFQNDWGEYTWNSPQTWVLETDKGYLDFAGVQISLEVVIRSGSRRSEKPITSPNEHITVPFLDGARVAAKVLILVMAT